MKCWRLHFQNKGFSQLESIPVGWYQRVTSLSQICHPCSCWSTCQTSDILQEHDKKFIDDIVWGEDVVQMEDVALCDLVQEGIFSPIYDVGRWVQKTYDIYWAVWYGVARGAQQKIGFVASTCSLTPHSSIQSDCSNWLQVCTRSWATNVPLPPIDQQRLRGDFLAIINAFILGQHL